MANVSKEKIFFLYLGVALGVYSFIANVQTLTSVIHARCCVFNNSLLTEIPADINNRVAGGETFASSGTQNTVGDDDATDEQLHCGSVCIEWFEMCGRSRSGDGVCGGPSFLCGTKAPVGSVTFEGTYKESGEPTYSQLIIASCDGVTFDSQWGPSDMPGPPEVGDSEEPSNPKYPWAPAMRTYYALIITTFTFAIIRELVKLVGFIANRGAFGTYDSVFMPLYIICNCHKLRELHEKYADARKYWHVLFWTLLFFDVISMATATILASSSSALQSSFGSQFQVELLLAAILVTVHHILTIRSVNDADSEDKDIIPQIVEFFQTLGKYFRNLPRGCSNLSCSCTTLFASLRVYVERMRANQRAREEARRQQQATAKIVLDIVDNPPSIPSKPLDSSSPTFDAILQRTTDIAALRLERGTILQQQRQQIVAAILQDITDDDSWKSISSSRVLNETSFAQPTYNAFAYDGDFMTPNQQNLRMPDVHDDGSSTSNLDDDDDGETFNEISIESVIHGDAAGMTYSASRPYYYLEDESASTTKDSLCTPSWVIPYDEEDTTLT